MSDEGHPLLDRLRAELGWPSWHDWPARVRAGPTLEVDVTAVDHDARRREVQSRLALAKLVGDGGPYLTIFAERAQARLNEEAGQPLGPLADFTFAIKDLIAVAGYPVRAGSFVRDDAPAEQATAPIVERLEALGAIATGSVTLHEFAFGVTGVNPYAGTAPNPRAPDRMPGGSSSGSAAAVADGSARIALGTDTGGSVRIPASFCGVVGFKPSVGLYPTDGVFPLSATLDHVGLFATNVADVITVHRALRYPVADAGGLRRVGVARADVDAADAEVRSAIEAAIERIAAAGIDVVDVAWPDAETTFVASTAILFPEAAAIHTESFEANGDRYGGDLQARLQIGAAITGTEVAAAHQLKRQITSQVLATLNDVDVIIGPTTPLVAPLLSDAGDPDLPGRIVANTRLGNVVGLPGVSLPVSVDGPPVGLQLMGANDGAVLAAAQQIESIVS